MLLAVRLCAGLPIFLYITRKNKHWIGKLLYAQGWQINNRLIKFNFFTFIWSTSFCTKPSNVKRQCVIQITLERLFPVQFGQLYDIMWFMWWYIHRICRGVTGGNIGQRMIPCKHCYLRGFVRNSRQNNGGNSKKFQLRFTYQRP